MAKIKISQKLASEIIDVVAEVAELLQDHGISLYTPHESVLQNRLGHISEKVFSKLETTWIKEDAR